jgi:hypothetical protein
MQPLSSLKKKKVSQVGSTPQDEKRESKASLMFFPQQDEKHGVMNEADTARNEARLSASSVNTLKTLNGALRQSPGRQNNMVDEQTKELEESSLLKDSKKQYKTVNHLESHQESRDSSIQAPETIKQSKSKRSTAFSRLSVQQPSNQPTAESKQPGSGTRADRIGEAKLGSQ